MQELPNNLLKKSELISGHCAPGVAAEALKHLMKGESAQAAFADYVHCDPVRALRLRALLLAAPVAAGSAQSMYAARWRQSDTI